MVLLLVALLGQPKAIELLRELARTATMATTEEEEKNKKRDELAEALEMLFVDVSAMVKGELQGANNQLRLLEKMNQRVAEEYNNFGDVAAGLTVFVDRLAQKNQNFDQYIQQIDAIDKQVTEFEAVISMLDKYVSLLEKKVQSVYGKSPT